MSRDIWGVFHDGVIARLDGTVPGQLNLEIDIEYLRAMFPGTGSKFIVTLVGCSKFVYRGYDEPPAEGLSLIQAKEPEILYIASIEPLVLDCADGTIELEYDEMRIALESGQTVTYEALVSAAERYWEQFRSRTSR